MLKEEVVKEMAEMEDGGREVQEGIHGRQRKPGMQEEGVLKQRTELERRAKK